ncbi:hypothetical protein ACFXTH_001055 [Malus domestica]
MSFRAFDFMYEICFLLLTAKLKGTVEEKRRRKIIANSLFLVSASGSDILRSYPSFIRKFQYDFPSYAALLVRSAATFVKDLYSLGARRIGVFSAVAIGCTPMEISSTELLRECLKLQNKRAELFNSLLSNELDYINSNFTEAKLVFLDIYHHSLDLNQCPQNSGFEVTKIGCRGTGTT